MEKLLLLVFFGFCYCVAVQHEYEKHEDSDCLTGNDLHSLWSDGTLDHDNCKEWCDNHDNCEGFVVSVENVCYFKSYECGNDIRRSNGLLYTKIDWNVCGRPAIPPTTSSGNQGLVKGEHKVIMCGGSLLRNNYIITTAHCGPRVGDAIYIGADYRNSCEEPCKRVRVTRVWEHEDYGKPRRHSNDLAIVRFTPSVTYNDDMSPICLPEGGYQPNDANTECYATGWGTLKYKGNLPYQLQQVQLLIVPQIQCRNLLGGNFTEQTMVCAGNVTAGGIDSCQGDSGGPLACHTIGENRWKLFGITSWGNGCGEAGEPGVYTKVTNYLEWIKNIINQ